MESLATKGSRIMSAVLAVAFCAWTPAGRGRTLEVGPGQEYADIQSAIDAAQEGADDVLVHAGEYEIDAELSLTKGIAVRAKDGREATVIRRANPSATNVARVVSINHAKARFEGFTVTGGRVRQNDNGTTSWPGAGAGVLIGANGGTLASCVVSNNVQLSAVCYGAGVAVLGASAVVTNCWITGNRIDATGDTRAYGGGICLYGGELVDCEIGDNVIATAYARGAVSLLGATNVRRCKIVRNAAPNAKFYDWGADWLATAGVYALASGSLIENCLIAENTSKGGTSLCGVGGGLAIDSVAVSVVNCTIVNNVAGIGGGVWTKSKSATFVNCLIQGNSADGEQQFSGRSYVVARNCICADAFTGASSSDNMTDAVLFRQGTYEPIANSASFGAGTTDGYAWLADTVDLKGNARVLDGAIDIGCYAFAYDGYDVSILADPEDARVFKGEEVAFAASIYPKPAAATYEWTVNGAFVSSAEAFSHAFSDYADVEIGLTVTIDGVSYAAVPHRFDVRPRTVYVVNSEVNPGQKPIAPFDSHRTAATSLTAALAHVRDGSIVSVSRGVYTSDDEIALTNAVTVVGVDGPRKTVFCRAGSPKANVVRRVFSLGHSGAVLSGVAIDGGSSGVGAESGWGAGVFLSSGTVSNCVVRNSRIEAAQNAFGSGVFMRGGLLTDSVVSNNTLLVDDQTYRHGGGAGVCLLGGTMRRCRVIGNRSVLRSGTALGRKQGGIGVLLQNGLIHDCLIAQNVSADYPAALDIEAPMGGGVAIVSNCTVTANRADNGVGGVRVAVGTKNDIVSCVNSCFSGNVGSGPKDVLSISGANGLSASFLFCFGPEEELPEGDGNVFGPDAKFTDPSSGSYRLRPDSPLIDAGVLSDGMETATDLGGAHRVIHGKVDIGCFEFPWRGTLFLLR